VPLRLAATLGLRRPVDSLCAVRCGGRLYALGAFVDPPSAGTSIEEVEYTNSNARTKMKGFLEHEC
jgi:hypothetical protein